MHSIQLADRWMELRRPPDARGLEALAKGAINSGAPIYLGSEAAVWGPRLLGSQCEIIVASESGFASAQNTAHAAENCQADLLQALSALNRSHIQGFLIRLAQNTSHEQLEGAIAFLENSIAEGLVGVGGFLIGQFGEPPIEWLSMIPPQSLVLAGDGEERTLRAAFEKGQITVSRQPSSNTKILLVPVLPTARNEMAVTA